MLSIFSGAGVELPIRYQPYIKLLISFKEYRQFCESLVRIDLPVLSLELELYRKALVAESDTLLVRLFYLDLSCAILHELELAANRGVDGTSFGVVFDYDSTTSIDINAVEHDIISQFTQQEIDEGLKSVSRDLNISIKPQLLSKHNSQMFKLIIALRCLSLRKNPLKYNINK